MFAFKRITNKKNSPIDGTSIKEDERSQATSAKDVSSLSLGSANSVLALPAPVAASVPKLYSNTKLAPIDLTFNNVREEYYTVNLAKAHHGVVRGQVARAKVSVCFVVKRPGCVLCHEQGGSLTELIAEFPQQSVAAWAVVKEINVDNEGLLNFYQRYFKFPFFRDTDMKMYRALGDRRVKLASALKMLRRAKKRVTRKGFEGSIIGKGEGMVLGGVMLFNRRGELKYAHQEKFGTELPVEEIRSAIKEIIAEGNRKHMAQYH